MKYTPVMTITALVLINADQILKKSESLAPQTPQTDRTRKHIDDSIYLPYDVIYLRRRLSVEYE